MVKNLLANAGASRDSSAIPGSGGSPGGGNDNPLQYSCLGSPTYRGAWRATVHGVAKSQTRLRTTAACLRYSDLFPLGRRGERDFWLLFPGS